MPQSLSFVIIHLIFSTKDRRGFLDGEFRSRMHGYLASICRKHRCECFRVGGTGDHVHLAVRLSRTITIAKIVEQLKSSSSIWAKEQSPNLYVFAWQRGYGCFSISPRDLDRLTAYIDNQEEHHRKRTFQEEFRMFLDKYGVKYNEAYRCGPKATLLRNIQATSVDKKRFTDAFWPHRVQRPCFRLVLNVWD